MREELTHLLPGHVHLLSGSRVCPFWDWDSNMTFSVKNIYFRLNDGGLRCLFVKIIWDIKALLKVKAFIWLIINDVIVTWDNLKKKDWQGPDICVLCTADEESIDHIFLRYPFSILI